MEFHEYLKTIRKAAGHTQQSISALLGIDRSTYAYYELGKTEPNIKNLRKLSEIFGVDLHSFLHMQTPSSVLTLSASKNDSECDPSMLSAEEQKLVELYRSCTNKEEFLAYVRAFGACDSEAL